MRKHLPLALSLLAVALSIGLPQLQAEPEFTTFSKIKAREIWLTDADGNARIKIGVFDREVTEPTARLVPVPAVEMMGERGKKNIVLMTPAQDAYVSVYSSSRHAACSIRTRQAADSVNGLLGTLSVTVKKDGAHRQVRLSDDGVMFKGPDLREAHFPGR